MLRASTLSHRERLSVKVEDMSSHKRRPLGLEWRASSWTVSFVIGLGIAVDLLVYSVIISVMPFHLEHLGYSKISSRTGWLLFAFSGGLVISTIPIAMFSEYYKARQIPLIMGLVILIGSQVMLMEAPNYAVMCLARVLQGVGSSVVWVVGLALLCDTSPPSILGLQIGVAMCGMSIGLAIGPPVGGLLYSRYGYRGPFVLGISATVIDLVGRLLIIERKEALAWGVDPRTITKAGDIVAADPLATASRPLDQQESPGSMQSSEKHDDSTQVVPETSEAPPTKSISLLSVIIQLSKSPRALVALFVIFVYGIVYSIQEPTIPLHLQHVWGLNSKTVGEVFIAAVVPTLFSSPLAGYLTDKHGAEWVTILSILLALPWWFLIIIEYRLAFFIAAFGIESFFTSGVIAPLTAELAAVAQSLEGVGYAHVYGAFNIIYGVGTSVGPIIGGQIYDNLRRGWLVLCVLSAGLLALSLILATCFVGKDPILQRLRRRRRMGE